jgi:hypothetical protein
VGIGINSKTCERAYRKHGSKWWKKIVSKTEYRIDILHEDISWEKACEEEIRLIKLHGRRDLGMGTLVNMTDGGEGTLGRIKSAEEIEKISGKNNGSSGKVWIKFENNEMFVQEELLEKYISEGWTKGRIISEAQRIKISNARKNEVCSTKRREAVSNQMKGHIKTDQERQRRSAALKGRFLWHNVPGFKQMTPEEKSKLRIRRLTEYYADKAPSVRSKFFKNYQAQLENISDQVLSKV